MATPYTKGKSGSNKAGGHTSHGTVLPKGAAPGAGSNTNTRIGSLGKRMHGAGGTKGMPK